MIDKVKIVPKIITIHEGRVSFYKADIARYRTNKQGQPIKTRPDGTPVKPRFGWTWLLDPSNAQAAATIKEIKEEAARQLDLFFGGRENWPKDNPTTGTKGILQCFGEGNKLPKVYDGYKDMWFIKVSDIEPPVIGDRRGREVRFLSRDGRYTFADGVERLGSESWHVIAPKGAPGAGLPTEEVADPGQIPYAGAFCRGRISLYPYNNESAGINANARSAQFLRPGAAFGGGGKRSAAEELEQMAGDAELATAAASDDPWG